MTQLFSPLVERALRIAARAHHGQNRKQTDCPYIAHPAAVALILQRAGFDDDAILAAAVLHDVVEDTDYSAEQLAADFPQPVPEYVAALTERKFDAAGEKRPWAIASGSTFYRFKARRGRSGRLCWPTSFTILVAR